MTLPCTYQNSNKTAAGPPEEASMKPSVKLHSFPWKLYYMLEFVHEEGNDGIISWLGDGRLFKIHDRSQFVAKILPRYFGEIKFRSFLKQLNLYNFKRKAEGIHRGVYYHECLVRGQPALCGSITRKATMKASQVLSSTGRSEFCNIEPTSLEEMKPPPSVMNTRGSNTCLFRGQPQRCDSMARKVMSKPSHFCSFSGGSESSVIEPTSLEELMKAQPLARNNWENKNVILHPNVADEIISLFVCDGESFPNRHGDATKPHEDETKTEEEFFLDQELTRMLRAILSPIDSDWEDILHHRV